MNDVAANTKRDDGIGNLQLDELSGRMLRFGPSFQLFDRVFDRASPSGWDKDNLAPIVKVQFSADIESTEP